jgi:tetratricopeptide (TPR) repeat protein
MRKALILGSGLFFALSLVLGAQVTVKEVRMSIPTYVTGPDDPAPPFALPGVYPYPMQTDITRAKVLKDYRVVVLENEYIRVLVLPDVGGRILAAEDKTNQDFDFIYHNHVVKPGLVALRGAWLSGGIEWNFPTLGHTVNTVAPVKYKILENEDGSKTCIVGTEEWVRRMKWEVFISVYPGRSFFTTRIRLENRTLTHNSGYFWANAATHDWDDTRVIFPPTNYTYAGGRSNPTPWPILGGKDVSWVKNTDHPYDYFCGTPGDFNAAYNYDHDNGTAHCANRNDSPGKKFWTWGTAPSGMIWEDLLTDADGQYIEVQSGRLLTQGDSWIFDPLLKEEWTEWWYPLKKMHGLVEATPEAALNVERRDTGVFLAVNVTRKQPGASIKVLRNDIEVYSEKADLDPAGSYQKVIPLDAKGGPLEFAVVDSENRVLILYSSAKPVIPAPELQPVITDAEARTAQDKYLQGYYALKHWDAEAAMGYFRRALDQDPNLVPALRWLGILLYKTGRTEEALPLFDRAVSRDEDDHVSRYYRALSRIRLGIDERVEDDLALVSRRAAMRPAAAYALGSYLVRRGDPKRISNWLSSGEAGGFSSTKMSIMKAVLWSKLGAGQRVVPMLDEILADDPLDSLALIEAHMLNEKRDLSVLVNDPEYFLEAAADYAEFGLEGFAADTIQLYLEMPQARRHPMLFYDFGYYLEKLGLLDDAAKRYTEAAGCSLDFIFPFRTEDEDVLRAALEMNPSDWKAHYLLGNLLTAEFRWEAGLAEFRKAAEANPPFAMLYRNIGELLWKRAGRPEEAVPMFEKAVTLDRGNFHLAGELDDLYAWTGNLAARDRLYRQAPEAVRKNFNIVLRRARWLVEKGEFDRALGLLKSNTFLPWEGGTSAHEVFVAANMKQALTSIARGKPGQALAYLEAARDYPQNLGTGRPANPVFGPQDYYAGVCLESEGRKAEADAAFERVIRAGLLGGPSGLYYQALALKRTGYEDEAGAVLRRMLGEAETALSKPEGGTGPALYQAALASLGLGDLGQARRYFESALKLEPSLRWTSLLVEEQGMRRK